LCRIFSFPPHFLGRDRILAIEAIDNNLSASAYRNEDDRLATVVVSHLRKHAILLVH
jgi:hypothetical protein